jgi:hypothetical protein
MTNKKVSKFTIKVPLTQKKDDVTAEITLNSSYLGMAVIDAFKSTWDMPRYFVFVCAGDFCQVS